MRCGRQGWWKVARLSKRLRTMRWGCSGALRSYRLGHSGLDDKNLSRLSDVSGQERRNVVAVEVYTSKPKVVFCPFAYSYIIQ